MLRTVRDDRKSDWKSYVPSLVHAYNSTTHDTTGYSPFFLMFGRKPRLPIDVLFRLGSPDEPADYMTFVAKLKHQLQEAYMIASANSTKSGRNNKRRYDRRVRGAVPVVGDRVLVKNIGQKGKHKLANKWQKDVYLVVGQNDPNLPVYQVQKESGAGNVRRVHRNLLLPLALPLEPTVTDVKKTADEVVIDHDTHAVVHPVVSQSDMEPDELHILYPPIDDDLHSEEDTRSIPSEEQASVSSNSDQSDDDAHSMSSVVQSEVSVSSISDEDEPQAPRRSGRNRRAPAWLRSGDYVTMSHRAPIPLHADTNQLKLVSKMYLSMMKYQREMF